MNHLNIEVPIIAAVNGPALIHAELAVLCDIVLAAEHAEFQDAPHFPNGIVPGDGVHVIGRWCLAPIADAIFCLPGRSSPLAKHSISESSAKSCRPRNCSQELGSWRVRLSFDRL
jgi:hypothetical protein